MLHNIEVNKSFIAFQTIFTETKQTTMSWQSDYQEEHMDGYPEDDDMDEIEQEEIEEDED